MKLYTEEQVIEAMIKCFLGHNIKTDYDYDLERKILKQLTPIELPSDEEIKDVASTNTISVQEEVGFEQGAFWMKEQILNQNK